MFAMCVAVPTTVAAADNNTTADTLYYGLSILEWAVVILAFIMLIGFFWMRHIYLFAGFIALLVMELLVHFFGT
ncbi:MAG: hypothetical protein PHV99_03715 [Candidatus Pacebacteria bacterium]|nr:hypothetical protein [Candidatus Paceibacterota bacterium]